MKVAVEEARSQKGIFAHRVPVRAGAPWKQASLHHRDQRSEYLNQELFSLRPARLGGEFPSGSMQLEIFPMLKTPQAAQKDLEGRRTKIDERSVLLYVDAKSIERNEAYEAFSAAC